MALISFGLGQADIEKGDSAMEMPERFVYRRFQIDTNRINSKNNEQNMNRLERWHSDEK